MPYDPNRHHRQSLRLHGYDYTQPGAYFVTICTHQRRCLFDSPALRRIAEQQWRRIADERVVLDAWVVMPDHVHGIVVITGLGAQQAPIMIGATPINNEQSRAKLDRSTGAPAAPLRGINVTLVRLLRPYVVSM